MPQEPNHVMQLTTLPEAIAIEQGTAAYWYTLSANQVRDLDQRHYSNRQRFNSAELVELELELDLVSSRYSKATA